MYCNNCGKEIPADVKFCQYCGNNVAVDLTQGNNNVLEQATPSPLNDSQKDFVAKELRIFLRLIGVSLIVTFLSVFVIYWANANNDEGLRPGLDRDTLIEVHQRNAVEDNTPKVFIYSVILLTLGRYVLKGIQWAESRSKK